MSRPLKRVETATSRLPMVYWP